MRFTLPGMDTLLNLLSLKHILPIVSSPSFSSTYLSALQLLKAKSPIDFRPCAALRSTYFRCSHVLNAESPTDVMLEGRTSFLILEKLKQYSSKVSRPSLILAEITLLP